MNVNEAGSPPEHVTPTTNAIETARSKLISTIPSNGIGFDQLKRHLQEEVAPGLNNNSSSPNYYGFVTGGATPAAAFADNLVTKYDQNVQVHLPKDTICTDVEDSALRQVCDLIKLDPEDWPHRTFTTGATASNIIGLALGREYVVREAAKRQGTQTTISEDGILEAMSSAGIERIQILTTAAHSSLRKAASILGLGRSSVHDVALPTQNHKFDLRKLEELLSKPNTASIVAISCAEVNTGLFATTTTESNTIRALCTKYSAWIHIDAAFGLLARALPPTNPSYTTLLSGAACLDIADSITGDAHKLLNVPYDSGILLSRSLDLANAVFQNPNAAYLSTAPPAAGERIVPSPLNIGIENSRRFRALPVYATLTAYGSVGYTEMLERQIALCRRIAAYVDSHPAYELLPESTRKNSESPRENSESTTKNSESTRENFDDIYIIVLFRATAPNLNKNLVSHLNATRKLYVSGTQWDSRPAARFAVSNWQVDVERDFGLVKGVLDGVASSSEAE